MAEGIVGAVLGGESEEASEPGEGTLSTALDPAAAAAAMDAAKSDPTLAEKAGNYFDKQARLVDIQTEHLHEQREVVLANLKLRGHGERLKIGMQVFFALVFTMIGLGIATMVYDAINSRSVVVEAFDTPAALAADGLSGRVVAGGLLDELTRLHAATHTSMARRQVVNDWSGGIKVEIPETGISVDEIARLLHERLGHDLHIGGDLVRTKAGGVALTIRGDGLLPKVFTGDSGDLDRLASQAAEYIYGESQPGLFAVYLDNMKRYDEAIAFAKSHLRGASLDDQAYLLNLWAVAIEEKGEPHAMAAALPLLREVVRIRPEFWNAYSNIMNDLGALGDEEGAIQTGRRMIQTAGGRPGRAPEDSYVNYDALTNDIQAVRVEFLANITATGGTIGNSTLQLQVAIADIRLHEVETARLRLTTAVWDAASHPDAGNAAIAQALLAEEAGDQQAAAKSWDDYAAAYATPEVATENPQQICWAAPAYQKTGRPAKADAALDAPMKAVGVGSFVDCYRFRGDVLNLRGDWAGAQAWYEKAAKLSPSFPSGSYSWGLALAKHGDLVAAEARFADANKAGPHWADPLKAWGDLLSGQGKRKEALAKYEEALKYAPAWKELHEARDAAASMK